MARKPPSQAVASESSVKEHLRSLVENALSRLAAAGSLALPEAVPPVAIDPPRNPAHGDFSSNIGLLLAKSCGMSPVAVAEAIVSAIGEDAGIERLEVVPPGFINFHLRQTAILGIVETLLRAPETCGRSNRGAGRRVQVEFVSANPTGPLHVGHGRGAAYGAALSNLLRAAGFEVCTEYYVNDAGRQMDILALSVWLRYLAQAGVELEFPGNGYRGDYIVDIAAELAERFGDRFQRATLSALAPTPEGDDEGALDARIAQCRAALGEADYRSLHGFACQSILAGIRSDLKMFGVEFDEWYSEHSLVERGRLDQALASLRASGHVYTAGGAEWFRSTTFGDEKDRVLVRENGAPTYFASDVAYHADKYQRGFTQIINIWGADHHGYIPRVKASLNALGLDATRLEVLLVQFASLFRGGEKVHMSTRSGQFVTLKELMEEVGVDAARYFYTSRRSDQHLDFDLDLAKAQSQDNPVYYLQYAHARICSVFRQIAQSRGQCEALDGLPHLMLLAEKREHHLAGLLTRYADTVASAAEQREPHAIANFLRELATEYHAYYNAHKINVDEAPLRQARVALCAAIRLVFAHGLALLGVTAPEEM
ncbi:MAG: arginyl-tRNA synthetase [Pseudomonadota bacterium]